MRSRWALILPLLAAPAAADVVVDRENRTVTLPARVAPRKINDPRFKEVYPVEVIATYPFPKGEKAHETVVTIDARPSDVHKALVSLGLKPGAPARAATDRQTGPEVRLLLEVGAGAAARRVPVERFLTDTRTGRPMPKVRWLFTGSAVRKTPGKPDAYGADASGTLIAIFPVTAETVFQSSLSKADEETVKLEVTDRLPKVGTAVKLIIVAGEAK